MTRPDPLTPALRAGLVLVVIAGLTLRLWHVERLGISHWDAGTFVAGPLGVGPYARADLAIFYAPPLVPEFFALLARVTGVVDTGAIAAVAVLGAASVAALFALGRRATGASAALAGAAALAGMEYHVVFSRQALTDVPFTLFLILFGCAWLRALASGRRIDFVLAGIAAGLALWTKYHGFFALVIAALHLLLLRVARRVDEREGWRSLRGFATTFAVAAALGLALALVIEGRVGLVTLRANNVRWLAELEPYVLPRTAAFYARCCTSWISPFVLVPAALGYARMLRRRSSGDLFLLAWTGLFAAALPLYTNYPRLAVPLLVPIALAAGIGIEACVRSIASFAAEARGARAVLGLSVVVLCAGALEGRRALALEDRGYAEAARHLRSQPATGAPDLAITQHALLPYLHGSAQPVVTYDEEGALDLLRADDVRFVVADLRLAKAASAPFRAWIEEHAYELDLVETIPCPLPETVIVNSAGFEGLDALRDGRLSPEDRLALTTIRVWRRRAP